MAGAPMLSSISFWPILHWRVILESIEFPLRKWCGVCPIFVPKRSPNSRTIFVSLIPSKGYLVPSHDAFSSSFGMGSGMDLTPLAFDVVVMVASKKYARTCFIVSSFDFNEWNQSRNEPALHILGDYSISSRFQFLPKAIATKQIGSYIKFNLFTSFVEVQNSFVGQLWKKFVSRALSNYRLKRDANDWDC